MGLDQEQYLAALAPLGLPPAWDITVVERARRKTVGFTVEPGGAITINVPPHTSTETVVEAMRRRATAIARAVADAVRLAPAYPVKELVDGEGFRLLDRHYRLQVTDDGLPARIERLQHVEGNAEWLCVRRDDKARMCRAIIALFCEQGLAWAQREGRAYEQRGGIAPGLTYAVRNLGKLRWGIYEGGGKHRLTLHWPALGLPYEQLEYVFVHELAHATRPPGKPHGRAWERQLTVWMPDWRLRKKALEEAGRHVWIGEYR